MSVWKPDKPTYDPADYASDPGPTGGVAPASTPTHPPVNPFSSTGAYLPTGFPPRPRASDFQFQGGGYDSASHVTALGEWNTLAASLAEFDEYGPGGWKGAQGSGGTPVDTGPAYAAVHAQNLSTFASAVIEQVSAEIEAGRLSLEQAQAEFDRRMDAFSEAGTQMAAMWQWTVPEGQAGKPLHSDIRGRLDMQPWISQAVEFDPFGEAMKIVEQSPEIGTTPVSTAPIDEVVALAKQFV